MIRLTGLTERQGEKVAIAVLFIAAFALALWIGSIFGSRAADCEARGGVLVRKPVGAWVCAKVLP